MKPYKLPGGHCSECGGQWWQHIDSVKLRNMGHVKQRYTDDYTEVPGFLDLDEHPVTNIDCQRVTQRRAR